MTVEAAGRHNRLAAFQGTRLIGRAQELDQARSLLLDERVRLLTITGPGGVGTRLALDVVEGCRDEFPDGAVAVDLSAVAEPSSSRRRSPTRSGSKKPARSRRRTS